MSNLLEMALPLGRLIMIAYPLWAYAFLLCKCPGQAGIFSGSTNAIRSLVFYGQRGRGSDKCQMIMPKLVLALTNLRALLGEPSSFPQA